MAWFVVIAKEGGVRPNKIYRGSNLLRIAKKIRQDVLKRNLVEWTPEMDRFVIEHYRSMTRATLAGIMRARFKQPITKNSLISRCNKLGLCRKKTFLTPISSGASLPD